MRALEYRQPRVMSDFALDFATEDAVFRGTCIDISVSGVKGSFAAEIPMAMEGTLTLWHPRNDATIPARVIYVQEDQVGFSFLARSASDREALSRFLGEIMAT